MKRTPPLLPTLLALASLVTVGIAADGPPPAPPKPAADGVLRGGQPAQLQIQVQGGVQLQLQGGAEIQIEEGGAVRKVAARPFIRKAPTGDTPLLFLPGFPSVFILNPAVFPNAKPGFLGVQLDTSDDDPAEDAAEKKEPAKQIAGVGILEVVGGSPAEKAGLKGADRVLKIEGKVAKTSAQLREMIRAQEPGRDVKLTVRREGKEIEVKVRLAAAPEVQAGLLQVEDGEPRAVPGVVVFSRTTNSFIRPASGTGGATSMTAEADKDAVLLRDGNRFTGKIRALDPAKGLVLAREGQRDVELIEEELSGVTFADRGKAGTPVKNAPPPAKVLLQLRDGSVLNGEALTMENGRLHLTMPDALRLEIPREHVQSVTLSDAEGVQIYEGPTGLSGWSSGRYTQGQWEYRDGLLRCITNGPIGRNLVRMPDPVDISFEVVFPRQMQHFSASLFSTGVSETGTGTLMMQFSPTQIFASHHDGRRSNQYRTEIPQDGARHDPNKAVAVQYRVLADRVNGKVLVYIDGVKRAEWTLSKVQKEDLGKCGGAISITPQVTISGFNFQLGRVRVLPWNGREPEGGKEPPAATGDLVLSGEGTATDGTIERITGGEIIFAKPGLRVLRDRSLFLRFKPSAAPGEPFAAVATVRMKDGSVLTATKIRGDGDRMHLTARFGQELVLPFSALREIEYLPREGRAEVLAKSLDVLTLTNGTQFKGSAVTPIAGDRVSWKIAASKEPFDFASGDVAGILFSNGDGARKTPPLKGGSAVRFGNGDWLPGDVVSLDAKHLVLNTDLSPGLKIPVETMSGLFLHPQVTASLADGATGADPWREGWNPNRSLLARQRTVTTGPVVQPWMYHDGSYTPTALSRTTQAMLAHHWPAYIGAYALNLEITNATRAPSFSVQLYNSKDERTFSISVSAGRVYVYVNSITAKLNRLAAGAKRFQVEEKTLATAGTTRLSIVLNRPDRIFRVIMGGKEIGKIPFKEDEAQEAFDVAGMSLTSTSYTSSGGNQNQVARIWIGPWDDTSAVAANRPAPAVGADPAKDSAPAPIIHLMNGDEFEGVIGKITPERVTAESDAGPLDLPGGRVAWIHFRGSTAAVTDHFPRLRFHDRGLLSVEELQIGNGTVKCRTLQGQALDFPLSFVKEAVWRPVAGK